MHWSVPIGSLVHLLLSVIIISQKPLGRVWGESVAVRSLEREGTSAFVDFGAFVPKFPGMWRTGSYEW